MIPFLLIATSLILGWTFGIIFFIVKVFLLLSPYRLFIIITSLILSCFFIVGILGTNIPSNSMYIWLYRIGAFWMGMVTIAFMIALIFFGGALIYGSLLDSRGVTVVFLAMVLLVNIW